MWWWWWCIIGYSSQNLLGASILEASTQSSRMMKISRSGASHGVWRRERESPCLQEAVLMVSLRCQIDKLSEEVSRLNVECWRWGNRDWPDLLWDLAGTKSSALQCTREGADKVSPSWIGKWRPLWWQRLEVLWLLAHGSKLGNTSTSWMYTSH